MVHGDVHRSHVAHFGVVGIDSGWELHVGGNGGVKVRVTDLLCKVTTPEEVLEHCGAFLQLYREEARYLERTAPWVERVGLAMIKQKVVENAAELLLEVLAAYDMTHRVVLEP